MLIISRVKLKPQHGGVLIEALVAILIFSLGIIGLLGLQAASIKSSGDAKYRSDASYLVNQIIAQMWVDRTNIDTYSHYPSGPTCSFTGAGSSSPFVTGWLSEITDKLPGANADKTQIVVSTVDGTKQIKVTICWKTPLETTPHNFVTTAQINP